MPGQNVRFEASPLELLLRGSWGAKPPTKTDYIYEPVTAIFCGLRSPSKACTKSHQCQTLLRDMQDRDMQAGLPDIRYNFVIGGDNKVYEGRGWATQPSLPSRYEKMQSHSIYIAFMGPLTPGGHRPNNHMVFQRNLLIDQGLKMRTINKRFLFILMYKI